jgi:predicted GH43/DUF377 family glycosyl hydrolase
MRAVAALCATLALAGCGRYADFTLPNPGPAESGSYTWRAQAAPVIPNRAVDTLNPSVFAWHGRLANLYSVFDGHTWRTALAMSADGVSWSEPRTVLSPEGWEGRYIAANGATVVFRGEVLHYYQAGERPRIALARSKDLVNWRKEPQPVIGYGPRGAWDERATADPDVIEAAGRLYMFYLGEDRARRQRLGVAVSDDGVKWTKLRASPVMELGAVGAFDENGLGEPAVWRAHGWWWMLYTGRARNEMRRMALVRSRDGLHWQPTGLVIEGAEAWNSKVVCDASAVVEPDRVRVWFGGGDKAQPAEHLNGQIGYGELIWSAGK